MTTPHGKQERTNARRSRLAREALLVELREALHAMDQQAWRIGDLVNRLTIGRQVTVKELAQQVGASRQRLSELRRTAAAFGPDERRLEVDFHFHTVAARAARRLRLKPAAVLNELVGKRIDSTRAATRYLAQRLREQAAADAAPAWGWPAVGDGLLDRCHHADFREVLPGLPPESIKLIIADAPYGTYGRYANGHHTQVSPTQRDCDGLADTEARQLVTDLFRISAGLMVEGGCLLLFRPGGLADPPWLMAAGGQFGWSCRHAVTWFKGMQKLGNAKEPYAPGTERVLVFALGDQPLLNHDGSPCNDVLQIPATRKAYTKLGQHLFEKPTALMERLIAKHSHPGEIVVEPFGGTGPASVASARLGRRWIYCESNHRNFELGAGCLAQELTKPTSHAG